MRATTIFCLLAAAAAAALSASASPLRAPTLSAVGASSSVLMIGVDGLTLDPTCLPDSAMPRLAELRHGGSWTRTARTAIQALSGPGWSSFLCGMPPTSTGVTSNSWTPAYAGGSPRLHPVTGATSRFPCALDEAKAQDPSLRVAAYYNWDFLSYLVDSSVVDKDYYCDGQRESYAACDAAIADEVVADISSGRQPDLAFVYFGDLDETGGHANGWCSDVYTGIAERIDGYLGRIVDALDAAGTRNTTAIVLSADHGGMFGQRLHGVARDDNILIPFVVNGPGIKVNHSISSTPVEVVDVAATALTLLGLETSSWWIGRFPKEVSAEDY